MFKIGTAFQIIGDCCLPPPLPPQTRSLCRLPGSEISVRKWPHQCQVKPVRAGQVPLIQELEAREDELEREAERGRGGGGGGEESACPSGTRRR